MNFDNLDLIVQDVPAAAAFLRDAVGLELVYVSERFAELRSDYVTFMLSPAALVPVRPAAGIILHFQVTDVPNALARAKKNGARVLLEPTKTDWGTESAMIAGPEEVIIDFYRPIDTGDS